MPSNFLYHHTTSRLITCESNVTSHIASDPVLFDQMRIHGFTWQWILQYQQPHHNPDPDLHDSLAYVEQYNETIMILYIYHSCFY